MERRSFIKIVGLVSVPVVTGCVSAHVDLDNYLQSETSLDVSDVQKVVSEDGTHEATVFEVDTNDSDIDEIVEGFVKGATIIYGARSIDEDARIKMDIVDINRIYHTTVEWCNDNREGNMSNEEHVSRVMDTVREYSD